MPIELKSYCSATAIKGMAGAFLGQEDIRQIVDRDFMEFNGLTSENSSHEDLGLIAGNYVTEWKLI